MRPVVIGTASCVIRQWTTCVNLPLLKERTSEMSKTLELHHHNAGGHHPRCDGPAESQAKRTHRLDLASHIEESTRHQLLSLSKGPSSFTAPQITCPDLPEEVQTRCTCQVVASFKAVLVLSSSQFSLKFGRSRLSSKPSCCLGHCATLRANESDTQCTDAAYALLSVVDHRTPQESLWFQLVAQRPQRQGSCLPSCPPFLSQIFPTRIGSKIV